MSKNYIQEGNVLPHLAAAVIASGAVVLMGKRIGIAVGDMAIGETGSVSMEGVFTVAKLSTDVVGQGDLLYWDAANSRMTTTAGALTLAGYAAAPAGSGVTTVEININA